MTEPKPCTGAGCAVDGGDGGMDACAADGCKTDAGPECRDGAFPLARMRLDLVFLVDDAASLSPWWPALREGLDQFLQQESSNGLGVGLQRFADVCDAQQYLQPIVPMAPLPGNLAAMQRELPEVAFTNTSTLPALEGTLKFARSWAMSNPEAHVAVVLLTDASPGSCDALNGDYMTEAPRLAREAYEGMLSIKTYVVGVSVLPALDTIAMAGGTQVMLINVVPADGEVLAALDNVRQIEQPCAFKWPSDWNLAPNSEVAIRPAGSTERRYPILSDRQACDRQDGFYVADSTAAYPLIACPSVCANLAAQEQPTLSRACAL